MPFISFTRTADQHGQALLMVTGALLVLMAAAGLAVDAGRVYLVRSQLAKAVDAAVLAGAQASGRPDQVAAIVRRVFAMNFPEAFMGIDGHPATVRLDINPDDREPDTGLAARSIAFEVRTAVPTTFLRVLGQNAIPVGQRAQAMRRVLDIIFVADRSASIGEGPLAIIKQAMKDFLQLFDTNLDRVGVLTFAGNIRWLEPRIDDRPGFDRRALLAALDEMELTGWTASGPALYAAMQELLQAPPVPGSEARWKVLLLFTDGTPNTIAINPQEFFLGRCRDGKTAREYCGATTECPEAPRADERWLRHAHLAAGELDHPAEANRHYIFGLFRPFSRPVRGQQNEVFQAWGFIDPKDDGARTGEVYSPSGSVIYALDDTLYDCEDPRHLVGTGLEGSDRRRERVAEPGRELPFTDANGMALTAVRRDGRPVSVREVRFALPTGLTAARWEAFRKKLNGAARNNLENVADIARATGLTIYVIGLDGEAGQMLRWNDEWRERGKDIGQRVANVPEAGEYFNPSQPRGLFVLADDASDLRRAFDLVAHAMLRLTQ